MLQKISVTYRGWGRTQTLQNNNSLLRNTDDFDYIKIKFLVQRTLTNYTGEKKQFTA